MEPLTQQERDRIDQEREEAAERRERFAPSGRDWWQAKEDAMSDLTACAATAMELASDPDVSDADVRCYVAVSLAAAMREVERTKLCGTEA